MHRALQQQSMARTLRTRLTRDAAPLAGAPGLQFDDSHMTLDPNELAQQLGLDPQQLQDLGVVPTSQPMNVDPQRVEELGAELRLRVDGGEINDDDLDRFVGLSSEERVAALQTLDPEQLQSLGDQ